MLEACNKVSLSLYTSHYTVIPPLVVTGNSTVNIQWNGKKHEKKGWKDSAGWRGHFRLVWQSILLMQVDKGAKKVRQSSCSMLQQNGNNPSNNESFGSSTVSTVSRVLLRCAIFTFFVCSSVSFVTAKGWTKTFFY